MIDPKKVNKLIEVEVDKGNAAEVKRILHLLTESHKLLEAAIKTGRTTLVADAGEVEKHALKKAPAKPKKKAPIPTKPIATAEKESAGKIEMFTPLYDITEVEDKELEDFPEYMKASKKELEDEFADRDLAFPAKWSKAELVKYLILDDEENE